MSHLKAEEEEEGILSFFVKHTRIGFFFVLRLLVHYLWMKNSQTLQSMNLHEKD